MYEYEFNSVWERVTQETNLKKIKDIADLLKTSVQNISNQKKKNRFPSKWAYEIGKKFNLSTKWILEGIEPKRIGGNDHQGQDTKIFKNDILYQIDEWLTEMVKDDPGRREWFRIDFEDKYPKFAEFKRKY